MSVGVGVSVLVGVGVGVSVEVDVGVAVSVGVHVAGSSATELSTVGEGGRKSDNRVDPRVEKNQRVAETHQKGRTENSEGGVLKEMVSFRFDVQLRPPRRVCSF